MFHGSVVLIGFKVSWFNVLLLRVQGWWVPEGLLSFRSHDLVSSYLLASKLLCLFGSYGFMAPWFYGSMVPWFHGSMAPWFYGSMILWFHFQKVIWFHGSTDPYSIAIFCHCSMVLIAVILWFHDATVSWYHGSMGPWFHCLMVLWFHVFTVL